MESPRNTEVPTKALAWMPLFLVLRQQFQEFVEVLGDEFVEKSTGKRKPSLVAPGSRYVSVLISSHS